MSTVIHLRGQYRQHGTSNTYAGTPPRSQGILERGTLVADDRDAALYSSYAIVSPSYSRILICSAVAKTNEGQRSEGQRIHKQTSSGAVMDMPLMCAVLQRIITDVPNGDAVGDA